MSEYANVPSKWSWVLELDGTPAIVMAGVKEYGTLEGAAGANNPRILAWADEVARCHPTTYTNWAADWYNKDSVPWCGLFTAICACRSANGNKTRLPPPSYLSALAWASFGVPVDWRGKLGNIWMGDIAVFTRSGGGHVGIVIAVSKDGKYIATLGGNQDNQVNIKLQPVANLYSVRRPRYNVAPKAARNFRISSTGVPVAASNA